MSHNSTLEPANAIGTSPTTTNGSLSKVGERDTDHMAALLARARDIIAGRLRPDPLPDWPGADARLHADFGDKVPPPTAEAIRRIKEEWSLDFNCRGHGVVSYRMDNGNLAILGVGDEEILLILRGLSDQELSNVVVIPNDPF